MVILKNSLCAALSDVKIGSGSFNLSSFLQPVSIESIAEQLIEKGVILPLVDIGAKVYSVICDDLNNEVFVSHSVVTEVGSRGFWVSGYVPDEDDMTDFFSWEQLGVTVYASELEASMAAEKVRAS